MICSVLAPLSIDELKEDLKEANFVTVSIGTSNMLEIKMVPVLERDLLPLEGMKIKILDLGSVPGETSDILCSFMVSVIKKYEPGQKVIGFSADN